MSISDHEGVILKTYIPTRQKLCILDAHLGKIECVPRNKNTAQRLVPGAYIAYKLSSWKVCYMLQESNILDMPLYWARNNFLFFHHILELCYYFLPFDSAAQEIFELIKILYNDHEIIQTDFSKKIFLCRFFSRLGIYPTDALSYDSCFFLLISRSLDSKVSAEEENKYNKQLQQWLLECISVHPGAHRLKTLHFLKK